MAEWPDNFKAVHTGMTRSEWEKLYQASWYEGEEEEPKTREDLREEYPNIIIPDSPDEWKRKLKKLRRRKRELLRHRPLSADILHIPNEQSS